jgi:1-acyl-sn-glycerol-3-phosphate acyltransferase
MIGDLVAYLYLLWPMTVGIICICFIVGIFFAISIGSFVVGFILAVYYGYIYLKERGFFEAVWKTTRENIRILNDRICKNIRETFLVKGHLQEVSEGPVLYIAHPHGLYSMAPFFHWGAGLTDWPRSRPIRVAIHSIFFKIPILREIAEAHGAIEATENAIREHLEKGESVALLTGGIRELQATESGKMRLVLGNRRGFLRIARSLRVPIVPVLSFGENELFPPYRSAWLEWIQGYMKQWFGVYIPVPTVSSLINWISLLQTPLESKVETWIGEAVSTKKGSLDSIRKEVFRSINTLYKEGKPNGYPETIEIL